MCQKEALIYALLSKRIYTRLLKRLHAFNENCFRFVKSFNKGLMLFCRELNSLSSHINDANTLHLRGCWGVMSRPKVPKSLNKACFQKCCVEISGVKKIDFHQDFLPAPVSSFFSIF